MAETAATPSPPADGDIVVVVRAPNQETQDFRVECPGSWTVRELKDHLQKTYNGNPVPADQKLIYSGQLLEDIAILRDVLRHEGASPSTHTVHLVCRPPKNSLEPQRSAAGSSSRAAGSQAGPSTSTSRASAYSVYQMTQTSPTAELRYRMPSFDATTAGSVSAAYSAHILAMQNMYAQYYQQLIVHQQAVMSGRPGPPMTSYVFNPSGFSMTVETVNGDPQTVQPNPFLFNQFHQFNNLNDNINNNDNSVNNNNLNFNNNNNPNMNNLNNNNNNNNNNDAAPNAAPAADDDENVREWDDYIYLAVRVVLLGMLVYLYSSAEKLVLVTGLGLLFYIYQQVRVGLQQQQQQAANPRPHPPIPPEADAAVNREPAAQDREDIDRLQAAMDNENPRAPAAGPRGIGRAEAAVAPQQSPIAAVVNLLKAFFVSLIP